MSEEQLERLRHSTAHVMAEAVMQVFPDAKFAIGPSIEDGFYYDFDLPRPLTPEDLETIEARMGEIIKARYPFQREEISRQEALERFADQPELPVLQVPQAAVDHPRRLRARPRDKIRLVDQQAAHPLERQLTEQPSPVHPTAENENGDLRVFPDALEDGLATVRHGWPTSYAQKPSVVAPCQWSNEMG